MGLFEIFDDHHHELVGYLNINVACSYTVCEKVDLLCTILFKKNKNKNINLLYIILL